MYQNKVGIIRYTDVIPDSCAECVCQEMYDMGMKALRKAEGSED